MKFQDELIAHIKNKPELLKLDNSFVLTHLQKHFATSDLDKYTSFDQALRSKKIKAKVRETRTYLRQVYGLFLNRPVGLDDVGRNTSFLLELHKSTQERVPYYVQFYQKMFTILKGWGLPEEFTVLDVACGYNPFAVSYMPMVPQRYVACDLSSQEMAVIEQFFKNESLSGEAFGQDVMDASFLRYLADHSFDVVFFFKALDSFERVKRHSSKKLLAAVNAPFIVVSFPLVSIGGGSTIQGSKRVWFENFCQKENWILESFELPNEVVYVVNKGV